MDENTLRNKILEFVIDSIKPENKNISYDDDLRDFGMDSVNCISIIVEIEDFYEFEFADEDLIIENFMTINRLADYVQKKTTREENI